MALAKTLGCARHILTGLASEIGQAAEAGGITLWSCYPLPIKGQLGRSAVDSPASPPTTSTRQSG
jgi:hypothetical protein